MKDSSKKSNLGIQVSHCPGQAGRLKTNLDPKKVYRSVKEYNPTVLQREKRE